MEELKYIEDHKIHTELGNEIPAWEKEIKAKKILLNKTYKKKLAAKDPKAEEWKVSQLAKSTAEDRRFALMRKAYDTIDLSLYDSISVRRRVRIIVSLLTSKILKKEKKRFTYPETLTEDQNNLMMDILVKGLSIIEKENRVIQEKTGHEL